MRSELPQHIWGLQKHCCSARAFYPADSCFLAHLAQDYLKSSTVSGRSLSQSCPCNTRWWTWSFYEPSWRSFTKLLSLICFPYLWLNDDTSPNWQDTPVDSWASKQPRHLFSPTILPFLVSQEGQLPLCTLGAKFLISLSWPLSKGTFQGNEVLSQIFLIYEDVNKPICRYFQKGAA